MAVPGSVYSAASAAPHLMVRSGQAVLVSDAAEVLELISKAGQHLITVPQGRSRRTDQLDATQLGVFEVLSASRRRSVGEVALAAGVSVPGCLVALGRLESLALVVGDANGWRATPLGSARVKGSGGPSVAKDQRAWRRNDSSKGPAVPDPESPSATKTATARSP